MTPRPQRLACLLAAAALGASAAAEPPRCSRVLPGPTFPREIVAHDRSAALPAAEDLGAEAGFVARVEAREFVVLQTLWLDLDGDGNRGEAVLVEGFRTGFWFPIAIPRILHRVADPRSPTSIWTQELPPGLAGPIRVEDIDGDGRDDVRGEILTVGPFFFLYSAGFQLLWGDGDQPLTVGQRSGTSPRIHAVDDVTGDGLRDLIVGAPLDDAGRTVYPATSARTFDEGIFVTPLADGVRIDEPYTWLEIADINNDGLDDAIAMTAFDFTDTLALSRGDGTFDTRPLDKPDPYSWPIVTRDFDDDGNSDLWARTRYGEDPAGFYIAWGHGDGTFDPYRFYETKQWPWFPHLADVDGDGRDEILYTGLGTVFLDGRDILRHVPFDSAIYAVADVDADGRDDLIYRSEDRLHVTWQPSLGDGTFGPARKILEDAPFDRWVGGVVPLDIDADGVLDLFVKLRPGTTRLWRDAVLRGLGDGAFELIWHSSEPFVLGGRQDVLADVDADGRPDLVSYEDHSAYDTPITHEVRIRRGNGLGFDPPMDVSWLSFAGKPGRFRKGRSVDMLRIGSFGNLWRGEIPGAAGIFQLELNPSLGTVLETDLEPPQVELRLLPGGAEDLWRVATLPLDDCSSSPRVTDRRIALLELPVGSLLTFRSASRTEVTIVEDTVTGTRAAVLGGPDRRRVMELFDEARRNGGFPFEHMKPMTLRVGNDYGPAVPGIPGARRVQHFVLQDGVVVSAAATFPGADLTLTTTAEDGVRSGRSSHSLRSLF